MRRFLIIFFSFTSLPLFSQSFSAVNISKDFSIIAGFNYISSATIQNSPFSSNQIERDFTTELFGGYGYGISIKKKLFRDDLAFGISTEYLKLEDNTLVQTLGSDTTRIRAAVTEKIWLYPVELTGYFNLPSFVDNLNIYLGGGVGVYFGDRKRSLLGIETETESITPGFNFLILSGIEYFIHDKFSGVLELRFREGEFTAKSTFPVSEVRANNRTYPIEKNLNSRIFVDGLRLSLGIGYHF
jgi:hypothetical protein